MKKFKKILLCFFSLVFFMGGSLIGYSLFGINALQSGISKDFGDLGIDEDSMKEIEEIKIKNNFNKDEIVNIALFGIDTRDMKSNKNSRSDSIIIASIDKKHNKIKLSSIMRDTYVKIDGHGYDKLNHAYAFGGPELAIKTLNQNFGLGITDYATVNFFGLEEIIDMIDGVKVDVKDYEVNEINKYIKESANIQKVKPDLLTEPGVQTLSGMQAVSYGRIRKVGNGDYERTQRQRTIIIAMINSLKENGLMNVIKLTGKASSFAETSLSTSEMVKLATDILQNMSDFTIEQKMFPEKGEGKIIKKVWYMVPDSISDERAGIQKFVFENND